MSYTLPAGHVLVLRCCDAGLKSHGGSFQWPSEGLVEAPDWRDDRECGGGLHGWLWGEGDVSAAGDTAHSAAGLRRLGNAVALWAGMACVVAGKCRPCVGTGIDYAETGPFPCEACDGRGYGPVRP